MIETPQQVLTRILRRRRAEGVSLAEKPREVRDELLRAWRVQAGFELYDMDTFVQRHGAELEALVALKLDRLTAQSGTLPETAAGFAAYDPIVEVQRRFDKFTDQEVLTDLMDKLGKGFRAGYRESTMLENFGLEYVETRAEAIRLRLRGWDAVPLLLESPALAVQSFGTTTIAVRDSFGRVAIHPDRRGTINHLYADLRAAEEEVQDIRQELDMPRGTQERLAELARALWAQSRKRGMS